MQLTLYFIYRNNKGDHPTRPTPTTAQEETMEMGTANNKDPKENQSITNDGTITQEGHV